MEIENFIDPQLEQAFAMAELETPKVVEQPAQVLSFHKLAITKQPEQKPSNPAKKRFIIRSEIIDKFTTRRTRIELTPSVCDVCAFDVAAEKHKDWHSVPESKKADVLQAVVEHKREAHPTKEDLIVYEDELSTSWLGNSTTL